jgi:hypothetical protein
MVLLSIRAGQRAKEIAMARWSMVTDAEGNIGDALHLPNKASKGKNGGRTVWLRAELRDALVALQAVRNPDPADHIIHSERDASMSPGAVQVWFHRLYQDLGFAGASSEIAMERVFIGAIRAEATSKADEWWEGSAPNSTRRCGRGRKRTRRPARSLKPCGLPAKARSYLKKLARVMAAEKLPVRWTTPAGFARKDLGELNAQQLPSGPPQKGSLKINDVLRADFAFA